MTIDSKAESAGWGVDAGLFAVPLGIFGLDAMWQSATVLATYPLLVSRFLVACGSVTFAVVLVVYGRGQIRSWRPGSERMRVTPAVGYIPMVAVLLAQHLMVPGEIARATGLVLAACTMGTAVWAGLSWRRHGIHLSELHPGYMVPYANAPFVAAIGLAHVGFDNAALFFIAAGVVAWMLVGGGFVARLVVHGMPEPAFAPYLIVIVAPPATAGLAWSAARGGRIDVVSVVLFIVMGTMVLVQPVLLRYYRRASLGAVTWVFAFPVLTAITYTLHGLDVCGFPGRDAAAWILTGLGTVLVVALAAASLARYAQWVIRRARPRECETRGS